MNKANQTPPSMKVGECKGKGADVRMTAVNPSPKKATMSHKGTCNKKG